MYDEPRISWVSGKERSRVIADTVAPNVSDGI